MSLPVLVGAAVTLWFLLAAGLTLALSRWFRYLREDNPDERR